MQDLGIEIRAITGEIELDRFNSLPYSLNGELLDDLRAGRRRPSWMWIARRGDEVVARVAWWGNPGSTQPSLLDIFDLADPGRSSDLEVARNLLEAALEHVIGGRTPPPQYLRYVQPAWRERDRGRVETEARVAIARDLGARVFAERLRLEWRPDAGAPCMSTRLTFRQPRDDHEVLDLMTAVVAGTLDAHTRLDLQTMTAAEAAREHFFGELDQQVSPRTNWQIALNLDGDVVGFVTPGHNHYHPVIGYLAVLPEHRGRGYIRDILAEGTAILANQGVDHIRAATDLDNTPMAMAFRRNGWHEFERSINMTWSK